jgi:hypothetical protein
MITLEFKNTAGVWGKFITQPESFETLFDARWWYAGFMEPKSHALQKRPVRFLNEAGEVVFYRPKGIYQ